MDANVHAFSKLPWEHVSRLGYHTITSAGVVARGKDLELTVRAPIYWDMGKDAHIVQLDVMHQTHCLNIIRKMIYTLTTIRSGR